MLSLGALSRFVIVEDSRPSGHIDEVKICATNEFVTVVLREKGTGSSWMQAHYPLMYSYMERFCYKTPKNHGKEDRLCYNMYDSFGEAIVSAVRWAEDRVSELEKAFKDIYKGFG